MYTMIIITNITSILFYFITIGAAFKVFSVLRAFTMNYILVQMSTVAQFLADMCNHQNNEKQRIQKIKTVPNHYIHIAQYRM